MRLNPLQVQWNGVFNHTINERTWLIVTAGQGDSKHSRPSRFTMKQRCFGCKRASPATAPTQPGAITKVWVPPEVNRGPTHHLRTCKLPGALPTGFTQRPLQTVETRGAPRGRGRRGERPAEASITPGLQQGPGPLCPRSSRPSPPQPLRFPPLPSVALPLPVAGSPRRRPERPPRRRRPQPAPQPAQQPPARHAATVGGAAGGFRRRPVRRWKPSVLPRKEGSGRRCRRNSKVNTKKSRTNPRTWSCVSLPPSTPPPSPPATAGPRGTGCSPMGRGSALRRCLGFNLGPGWWLVGRLCARGASAARTKVPPGQGWSTCGRWGFC